MGAGSRTPGYQGRSAAGELFDDSRKPGRTPPLRWFPYRSGTGLYYAPAVLQAPDPPPDAAVIYIGLPDDDRWEAALIDAGYERTVIYRGDDLRAALRTAEAAVSYDRRRNP